MKDINWICNQRNRMCSIVQPGDHIEAIIHYQHCGLICKLEIRSVTHWGVYAVITPTERERMTQGHTPSYAAGLTSRQYLVKWRNVIEIILDAPDKQDN